MRMAHGTWAAMARACAVYVGITWALSEGASQILPVFDVPNTVIRRIILVALAGLPLWALVAWHKGSAQRLGLRAYLVLGVAFTLLATGAVVLAGHAARPASTLAVATSIAVVPFANLSADKGQDYLADGLTEEFISVLARVPQLQVTARTTSFALRERRLSIDEIERVLHVGYVLEGSVRKFGDRIRVSAELIRLADSQRLWQQDYERTFDDVFALQDEIATDVAAHVFAKIHVELVPVRRMQPAVYLLYLRARQLARVRSPESLAESDQLLQQAERLDPADVLLRDQIASNLMQETSIGLVPGGEGLDLAARITEQALALDAAHGPAHARLGRIAMLRGDFDQAALHLRRALELDAGDVDVLRDAALLLECLGRLDQARAVLGAVLARDPLNVSVQYNLAIAELWAGHADEAEARLQNVLQSSPHYAGAHYSLGLIALSRQDLDAAVAQMQAEPSELWRLVGQSIMSSANGDRPGSDRLIARLKERYSSDVPYNIAAIFAYRGELDECFAWLERAIKEQDGGLAEIANERLFLPAHADERWQKLLQRLNRLPTTLDAVMFTVPIPGVPRTGADAAQPFEGFAT